MNYIVQSGDTLSAIARRFRLSLAAIVTANNIDDPNVIQVGQELMIPDAAQPVTVDQAGTVIQNAPNPAPGATPAMASDSMADWLKPPKLFYLLAALAAGVYFFNKGNRK